MINDLNIAVVPLDIAWADRDENLFNAASAIKWLPAKTDLVVLPELFSTGFVSDPVNLAKLADTPRHAPTLDAMKAWAAENNCAVCGSLLHSPDAMSYTNRCVFVEPSGDVTWYDKRHLFGQSLEATVLNHGNAPMPTVRFRGWSIAMCVCYDLRFPVWLRNTPVRYDLLLVPANWPATRSHAWQTLLAARAIENLAWVVGANRTGSDDFGQYGNTSAIYDHLGTAVSQQDGPYLKATAVRAALDTFRQKNRFADDADRFSL